MKFSKMVEQLKSDLAAMTAENETIRKTWQEEIDIRDEMINGLIEAEATTKDAVIAMTAERDDFSTALTGRIKSINTLIKELREIVKGGES